jgi:hypothetical protein
MRTIDFNIDGADATDTIAKMLLDLPHGGKSNSVKFNREGIQFTLVARLADGRWMVSLRPHDNDPSRRRYYSNPVDAARVVIGGRHLDVDVTDIVLAR